MLSRGQSRVDQIPANQRTTSINKFESSWKSEIGRWRPWGHPIGVKAAASWSLCPDLQLPDGVESLRCDGATCMAVCEVGKVSMGRRRTKCRFKRTKGFFWGRELAPCQGCDPEIAHPVWDVDHVMMGDYLVGRCVVDEKMRKNCKIECPKGAKVTMADSITLQRKVALKVKAMTFLLSGYCRMYPKCR